MNRIYIFWTSSLVFLTSAITYAGKFEDGLAALQEKKYDQAKEFFKEAALEGNVEAQTKLLHMLMNYQSVTTQFFTPDLQKAYLKSQETEEQKSNLGIFTFLKLDGNDNYPKAFELLKTSIQAKKKNPDALYFLANLYMGVPLSGISFLAYPGVPRDEAKGNAIFGIAAELGSAVAQEYLGKMMLLGAQKIPKNQKKGLEYLEKSSRQGLYTASIALGRIYLFGEHEVPVDLVRAKSLLEPLAGEHRDAKYLLGRIYWEGLGVPADLQLGKKLIEEAEKSGSLEARAFLGIQYRIGKNLPRDLKKARDILSSVVNSNSAEISADTYSHLGIMLLEGEGGPEDKPRAIQYLKTAESLGSVRARSRLDLLMYSFNPKKAEESLKSSAEKGDADAYNYLGVIYLNQRDASKKAIAREYFEKAIHLGSIDAQFELAKMFLYGIGGPANEAKGIQLLEQAAAQNDPHAQLLLGEWYLPKNPVLGKELIEKAAAQNLAGAFTQLGQIYLENEKFKDYQKARTYFEKAQDRDAEARAMLGQIYLKGMGVRINVEKAQKLLEESVDEAPDVLGLLGDLYRSKDMKKAIQTFKKGLTFPPNSTAYLHSSFYLGQVYLTGEGGAPRDQKRGIELITQAAEGGLPAAQSDLAGYYREGVYGLNQDMKKAFELYKKSEKLHESTYQLSVFYRDGIVVEQDPKQALDLLQRAATEGSAKAMVDLGKLYKKGNQVPKNLDEAENLFKKATEAESAAGQFELALIYLGRKEDREARKLLEKASQKGFSRAQAVLGNLYRQENTNTSLRKARTLYQSAADQGDPFARQALGSMYRSGYGAEKDLVKAKELLLAAEAAGNVPQASMELGEMYENGETNKEKKAEFQQAKLHYEKAAIGGLGEAYTKLGIFYREGKGGPKNIVRAARDFEAAKAFGSVNAVEHLKTLRPTKSEDGLVTAWTTAIDQNEATTLGKVCAESIAVAQKELVEERNQLQIKLNHLRKTQEDQKDPKLHNKIEEEIDRINTAYKEIPTKPECPICFECKDTLMSPQCALVRNSKVAHYFCDTCFLRAIENSGVCPTCKTPGCQEKPTGIDLSKIPPPNPLVDPKVKETDRKTKQLPVEAEKPASNEKQNIEVRPGI